MKATGAIEACDLRIGDRILSPPEPGMQTFEPFSIAHFPRTVRGATTVGGYVYASNQLVNVERVYVEPLRRREEAN